MRTVGLLSVLPIIWTTKHVVLHVTMQHGLVPHLALDLVDVRARSAGEAHALLSLRQAVRSRGLWRAGPLDHWVGEQRFPIGRALQAGVPVLVGYERTSRSRRLPHVGQKCMRRRSDAS